MARGAGIAVIDTRWWISKKAREVYFAKVLPALGAPPQSWTQTLFTLERISLAAVRVGPSPCGRHHAYAHPNAPGWWFIVSSDKRGNGEHPSLITVMREQLTQAAACSSAAG